MPVYKSINLENALSVRIEDIYQNLLDSDKVLIQINELERLCNHKTDASLSITSILRKASAEWFDKRLWSKAEPINKLLLQIAIQNGDISEIRQALLVLLNCLEKQHNQSRTLKEIIILVEKYISEDNPLSLQIILVYKLIHSYLKLYGIDERVLEYYLSYKSLILRCSDLIFANAFDLDFYKCIYLGITSFYFFDNPIENNSTRQILARLGLRAIESIFMPEIENYKNKISI